MIREDPFPVKKIFAWCFIIAGGLITAYIGLISLVSVWVGLTHIHLFGSWAPILAGTALLFIVSLVYFRVVRAILTRRNKEELLDVVRN
ncbi:MAG: hypothetical protein KJ573_00680 [Proteobacteria bacterium]|jgi:hypothetical protein|nr:hypothetical protein [Pseudomonadota bacterium]